MPRAYTETEPQIINQIITSKERLPETLEIATSNQKKLEEFRRMLPKVSVVGIDLDVDEIQSTNPHEVAAKKAKTAWEKNKFNPILVEDTSLDIAALNGFPGTYANSFTKEPLMRKII
ncbi:non-canonical purine NTP pyrophosphatase, partial [candidate division WWE3 bacterium]